MRGPVGCGRPPGTVAGLTVDDDFRAGQPPALGRERVDRENAARRTIDAPWTDDDPDREFQISVTVPLTQLLEDYRAACARHRDQVASLDLDTPSQGELGWRTEPVTLRWILFHLTEETARHNGHLDLLRELADGARGR